MYCYGILFQVKMNFFISVCNEVPEHPCISPVSNHVFERRLIEKYIAENGTDPMNGQPLSEEQLVDIKGKRYAAISLMRRFDTYSITKTIIDLFLFFYLAYVAENRTDPYSHLLLYFCLLCSFDQFEMNNQTSKNYFIKTFY